MAMPALLGLGLQNRLEYPMIRSRVILASLIGGALPWAALYVWLVWM